MAKIVVGISVFFIYTLMVMGNIVTTTGSGLACPDWPLCYGTLTPPMRLDIWIEWSHRLLGATTGFLILSSTILVWFKGRGVGRWLTGSSLGLLLLGATFGGVIVLVEAPLLEGPLHILIVSFHIILATIIFALMIITFRKLPGSDVSGDDKWIYILLFAVVSVQVILGIFVRYGEAGLACPDFPLCQGEVVPPLVDFETTIHFVHRVMALTIFLITSAYLFIAIKSGEDIKNAAITFGLVIAQATLGISVVLSGMFLPYIVAHGGIGFLLLGWLTYRSAPMLIKAQPA